MSGGALKRALPAPRADFPILSQGRGRHPLAYLDSAATAQKPRAVIEALTEFYQEDNANIHRAVYQLGERATARYEAAREQVQSFINARDSREVIFVRGATEAINLVASGLAQRLTKGDEVLITSLEHHTIFAHSDDRTTYIVFRLVVNTIKLSGCCADHRHKDQWDQKTRLWFWKQVHGCQSFQVQCASESSRRYLATKPK